MTPEPTGVVGDPSDRYGRSRPHAVASSHAYHDAGEGRSIVFLHGNPTSSYLWRNDPPPGGSRALHRHRDRVAGIAFMEAIVHPLRWDDWPDNARDIFRGFRSETGEEMAIDKNLFVEAVLPASIQRHLSDAEHDAKQPRWTGPP